MQDSTQPENTNLTEPESSIDTYNQEPVDTRKSKDTNGPMYVVAGAITALGSYGLGLLFSDQLNLGGVFLIWYIAVPLGGLLFLFGCFKSFLFFGELTRNMRLVLTFAVILSAITLVGIVAYLRSSATEPEFTSNEQQCAQQLGTNLTEEQFQAYQACLSE